MRRRDRADLGRDLGCELAGGYQHEPGRARVARVEPLDERHGEGKRFAGARRRLREDVAAGEGIREHEPLDPEGSEDVARGKRFCDARRHTQLEERLHIRFRLLRVRTRSACLVRLCHHRGYRRRTNLTGRHHAVRKEQSSSRGVDSVRPMISFARGAPAPECLDADLLADCARVAIETDPSVLAYGSGGGYAPLRESLGARHGVDPGRVLLTTGGLQGFVFYAEELLGSRPGRVLVEAPTYDRPLKILARLRSRRRGAPDGRRRTRPGRARARARRGRDELPLHDPDLPEPERPHPLDRAAPPRRRARTRRTESPCSRTTRTGSSATRARRRRRSSTWRAARSSPTPPPSRRPSRRGCVSAGSSRRQSSPPASRHARCPPTSHRRS